MSAIRTLVELLAGRRNAADLAPREWDGVIAVARAEALLATLAHGIDAAALPQSVAQLLADARAAADVATAQALWEAEMARRALAPAGIDFVLLKGAAYAAADLPCAPGRQIGDLDILVARETLPAAEAVLLSAGWEWVKEDAYDDAYYRDHMHELPPLIHKLRDRMIDVHHTIIPPTARPNPDAASMLARAIMLPNGYKVLHPFDRLIHCAAHLFADGDLAGGLRNLWDFHCLVRDFQTRGDCDSDTPDGALGYDEWLGDMGHRAKLWGLGPAVRRASHLSAALFGAGGDYRRLSFSDRLFLARLFARDDWGREKRPFLRLAFYIRSHWLRMPPPMLLRHLWTKWRKGRAAAR
jgi:hypothetical protein